MASRSDVLPLMAADRRRFLMASAAVAVGAVSPGLFLPRRLPGAESSTQSADQLVAGKDRRLIVHSAEPLELETPLTVLRGERLTSTQSMFVRNNQAPAWAHTLEPPSTKDWKVEFAGLVEYPRVVPLAELAGLPQVEHEMVLQCSGNGRAQFGRAASVKGSPWNHGAMANVRFRGVPLAAVLQKFDIRPNAAAKFLTAEGIDSPASSTAADFEHSLPLADTLDRSILALEMNGKPLPSLHGGPVRLITPGYYGTMQVKWLSRVRFEPQETVNHHQVKRYRTPLRPVEPGAKFDYALDNSEANWNMRIKSVIFAPAEGEQLPAGRATLSGVAWNDGQARIEAVEWSRDGGRHWQRAELESPRSPYAWHPWRAELTLDRGEHTIAVRAVDTLGRTQPLDGAIGWNPAGYGWHGVHTITVKVV